MSKTRMRGSEDSFEHFLSEMTRMDPADIADDSYKWSPSLLQIVVLTPLKHFNPHANV